MANLEQNGGPLTLEHDVTPRDMSKFYGGTSDISKPNYRFQGYPESSFNKPKQPVLGGPLQDLPQYGGHDNPHAKRAHFIVGRPVNGLDSTLEYSSDTVQQPRQTPQPKRTLVFRSDGSAEERKKLIQKREAEEDIARFKAVQQQQYYHETEEKRKDLEMLRAYQPFGKPGGGAPPSQQPRRTKLIANMDYLGRNEMDVTDPNVNFEFGKPGAGAPNRSSSGHVVTNVRQDAEIHFQKNRGGAAAIHNHKRYTDPINTARNYQSELDDLALEQRTRKEMEKYNDRTQERKSWDYNPFGKPGAGAPIKTDSGRVKKARGMTLTNDCFEMRNNQDKETFRSLRGKPQEERIKKENSDYDPWGKGYGVPNRDKLGYVKRHKWGDPVGIREYVDPNVSGGTLETKSLGGGGHLVDERGQKVTKMKTTLEQDKSGEPLALPVGSTNGSNSYNPWGKPGAGAPITTDSGKVVTQTAGKVIQDRMGLSPYNPVKQGAKQQYLKELQSEIQTQHQMKQQQDYDLKSGGEELASWMRRGQVGYPKRDPVTGQHLSNPKQTSDVTAQRMDIRRQVVPEYQTALDRQAYDRSKQQQIAKKESALLSERHLDTMNGVWGRPGGGAPVGGYGNKKQTLDMERSVQGGEQVQAPWAVYTM
ncbi:uncharacterized protein LOC144447527 [Glandiceps talaboti]